MNSVVNLGRTRKLSRLQKVKSVHEGGPHPEHPNPRNTSFGKFASFAVGAAALPNRALPQMKFASPKPDFLDRLGSLRLHARRRAAGRPVVLLATLGGIWPGEDGPDPPTRAGGRFVRPDDSEPIRHMQPPSPAVPRGEVAGLRSSATQSGLATVIKKTINVTV